MCWGATSAVEHWRGRARYSKSCLELVALPLGKPWYDKVGQLLHLHKLKEAVMGNPLQDSSRQQTLMVRPAGSGRESKLSCSRVDFSKRLQGKEC